MSAEGKRIFILLSHVGHFSKTPLALAARSGYVECVNALLQYGADVTVKLVRID